jgi:xanthine dehydrogenase accessory factor
MNLFSSPAADLPIMRRVRAAPVAAPAQVCHDQKRMQDEIFKAIHEAVENGEPVVLATVARTRGSTPRKTGAKMVVRNDGSFFGTIGGGCGEAEVWQEAMDVIQDGRARIVTVDLTEPTDGEDKICGGVMDVFVERIG